MHRPGGHGHVSLSSFFLLLLPLTCKSVAPKVCDWIYSSVELDRNIDIITCVRAEHSTYFTALRSLASFSAVSGVMGFCLFLASFSMVDGSSRKSIWVPTSKKGVFGQWWVISGTHWEQKHWKVQWARGLLGVFYEIIVNACCIHHQQDLPFLWHFQRKRVTRRRNRRGRHLSGGNSEVVTCRSLPDLEKTRTDKLNSQSMAIEKLSGCAKPHGPSQIVSTHKCSLKLACGLYDSKFSPRPPFKIIWTIHSTRSTQRQWENRWYFHKLDIRDIRQKE